MQGFGRVGVRRADIELWFGAASLAALVLVPILNSPAAFGFLLAGIVVLALRPTATLTALLAHRRLLVLPVFCTLSVLWSQVPALSFRFGLQLTATFVIAIVLASRLSLRTFLTTIFAVLFAAIAFGIATGTFRSDTGALLGYYASKNAMAGAASLLALIAIAIAATPGKSRGMRFIAAIGALVGIAATVLAQSAGALMYLTVGVGGFFAIIVLRPARPAKRILIGSFALLGIALGGILFSLYADAIAATLLDFTGKDMTLTGRTDLWRIALRMIAERPALGVGYQAFWVQGSAPAETLWMMFGIEARSGFNFHNTYISNAVEIGLIGVAIQTAMIFASVLLSARLALRTGNGGAALLFAISLMSLAMTPIEVAVFFQFSLPSVLVVATIVYAIDGLRRSPAQR